MAIASVRYLVRGEETVFDAVDACPDARADCAVAHRMSSDPHARAMGFVGDRGELFVGVLLSTGGGAVGHHASGRRHLDQLGAVANLIAHACPYLVDTIGDALGDRKRHDARCESLKHSGVEVSAVRGDGMPGRNNSGADVPALLDGSLQCDVEQIATGLHHEAEVAHGGEAGLERGPRIHRAAQGAIRGIVLHPVHRAGQAVWPTRATDQQVELHVHQAGQ
jgi:hypothetical protein